MRLDYVVLLVDDLDRAVTFYTDVVGFELGHRSGPYAQFATGSTRFALYERDAMAEVLGLGALAPASPDRPAFEIGCKVERCDEAFERLVARGAAPVVAPTERPWGQRTAYVRDPDGHLLELAEDLGGASERET